MGLAFGALALLTAEFIATSRGLLMGAGVSLAAVLLQSALHFRRILTWSGYMGAAAQIRSTHPFDISWPTALSAPLALYALNAQGLSGINMLPGILAWTATLLLSIAGILALVLAVAERRWSDWPN